MTVEHGGREAGAGGQVLPALPTPEGPPTEPVEPVLDATPAPPDRRSVRALAEFIVEEAGPPVDVWAIAALLESTGIRDSDARDRYGMPDVFALARAVEAKITDPRPPPPAEEDTASRRERLRRYARVFGRGIFFFVPLAMQLAALLIVGVSLYASLNFTTGQASIVAVAASLSFVITGAFVQGTGYLGPLFIEPGKHQLAERVLWSTLAAGLVVSLALGGVLVAVALVTGSYTGDQVERLFVYYALLAVQALTSGALYTLKRYGLMLVGTAAGLVVAGLLYHQTDLRIEHVHWLALATAGGLEAGIVAWTLHRRAKETRGDMRLARLPRIWLLVRRSAPYALYGLLYFLLLTADRGVAWGYGDHPQPFWFSTEYELGLDWALAALVLSLAFLEITVERFSARLTPAAVAHSLDAVREHNRTFLAFWSRQLAYVAALAAAGAWVAVVTAWGLAELGALGPARAIYEDPVARYVFAGGIVGYSFLALGIANSVFLMGLARPWPVLATLLPSSIVSIAAGIALTSATGAYWTAVGGMVAGMFIFAAGTGFYARRTLRYVDYHAYAAW